MGGVSSKPPVSSPAVNIKGEGYGVSPRPSVIPTFAGMTEVLTQE